MRFKEYYQALDAKEKDQLARDAGTSVAYLSQLAHGHRLPGGMLVLTILALSNGAVDPSPDSFGKP